MKKLKPLITVIILLGFIIIGCKRDDLSLETTSRSGSEQLKKKYQKSKSTSNIQNLEDFAGYPFSSTPVPTTEVEAESIVAPLMDNSKQFFYDMGLSNQDLLEEFDSLDDYKIAYVAFAMQAIDTQPGGGIPGCNSNNKIVKCIVQSLIPCTILDFFNGRARDLLISQGFRAGFNALSYAGKKSVVRILATNAGRMFGGGALSLTLFVYDFGVCLLSDSSSSPTGSLVLITTTSNLLPTPLPSNVYYMTTEADALNFGKFPAFGTTIFFNSNDSKYYVDSNYTTLVPDGYYHDGSLITGTNYQLHHIVNGVAIAVYELVPN